MGKEIASAQSLGIDIGASDLVCNYSRQYADIKAIKTKATRSFKNIPKDHAELYSWLCKKAKGCEQELVIVMEATESYYENLAYYLAKEAQNSFLQRSCLKTQSKVA